ncbi:gasdermin-D-like [Balaenoptera musculus]|uniref:Gasdermin-D-like n=1 Tax=Balaenoptera musculus TaxID=9771 RepID=A0A8B8VQM5_BALMU|nr:gasdermin-D-like [Balaenoptera musculus]
MDSLASALRLRPFCLVRKKHRRHLWPWDAPLIPTDFSLVDALEPGSPIPAWTSLPAEVSRSEPIHLREMVAGAVTGGVSVGTGLQGSVAGSGVVSHSSALAVQTLRAPPNTWETLVEKRPADRPAARRPPLRCLRQHRVQAARFERPLRGGALESSPTSSASPPAHTPRARQETEHSEALVPQGAAEPQGEGEPACGDKAVEAAEDATLQSLSRGDGAGRLSLLRPSRFKLQGQSTMAKEKTVAIPRGTVLAYSVLQLVMEEDRWAVLYLPEGKLWRDSSGVTPCHSGREGRVLSPQWEGDELEKPGPGCGEKDGTASGRAPGEEPDFRGLQRQARAQLQDLATLPPELRDPLLGALQELLQDPWALQELEDTLEQALDTGVLGQLGGPGGLLLIILRDPSGSLSPSKGRAILCILGALADLSSLCRVGYTQVYSQMALDSSLAPGRLLGPESTEGRGSPVRHRLLKGTLQQVASILEPDFNQMEETTFSLPPAVLSSLQSEDVALTRSLVEGWLQLLAGPGPAALRADA